MDSANNQHGGSFKDLKVYRLAYQFATEIFSLTQTFPKEETYSLSDQIRRSSRSVCANIAEAYRKRRYMKHFTLKITDADAEASETSVWLDFARDANDISLEAHRELTDGYHKVGRMLGSMQAHPERFLPNEDQVSEEEIIYDSEDQE